MRDRYVNGPFSLVFSIPLQMTTLVKLPSGINISSKTEETKSCPGLSCLEYNIR